MFHDIYRHIPQQTTTSSVRPPVWHLQASVFRGYHRQVAGGIQGWRSWRERLSCKSIPMALAQNKRLTIWHLILDFNLLVWRSAELNGIDVPHIWYDRLDVACDYIQHIMDVANNTPTIGDSDEAWVVRLDERVEVNNFQSILTSAAILLNRSDLKAISNRKDEKSFWLLSIDGWTSYQKLANTPSKCSSRLFDVGGYAVMRTDSQIVTFDCGPLGYLATAAHGHADALSIHLSANGYPLLIDPNTFAYQEGYQWRERFRGTAAHNTVLVDNQNQSKLIGTFLWGRKADARCLHWRTMPEYDLIVGEHDGYQGKGVTHRRTLFFAKPDWLVVTDRLLDDIILNNSGTFRHTANCV